MTVTVHYPPALPSVPVKTPTVFLAGTIDMGNSYDWQSAVVEQLSNQEGLDAIVFNPRRPDWDSSWVQDISCPEFREQVEWELDYIETTNYVLMHFEPESLSPVTLLELGLLAFSPRGIFVSCPPGYWRRGNIQVFCVRYGIRMFDSLDQATVALTTHLLGEYRRD